MLYSVYCSNQTSFDPTADYANIGIEHYFNDENILTKIDPNIAEDARLDTVIILIYFQCNFKKADLILGILPNPW